MQIFTPLRSSIETYRTHVRSLRVWVLELYAWWVMRFGSRADRMAVRRDIRDARREVRELLFLTMVSRMTFQRRARRWMRPPSVRRGFRHAQRRLNLIQLYTRGIRLRSLRDIRDALNDFERIVERAIARVPTGVCTGNLRIAAPPAPAFACNAPAPATEGADTS